MSDNIKLINEDGVIKGIDPESGDTIPITFDSLDTDALLTAEAERIPTEINGMSNPFDTAVVKLPERSSGVVKINLAKIPASDTGASSFDMQVSTDGGTTFERTGYSYLTEQKLSDGSTNYTNGKNDSRAVILPEDGWPTEQSNEKTPITITISSPYDTKDVRFSWDGNSAQARGAAGRVAGAATHDGEKQVNAVRFLEANDEKPVSGHVSFAPGGPI